MISKKQFLTVIGAFLLVVMLGTITYAFFNYTRTGTANVIRTGKISFNSTQGQAINLTNMFPIDVSNGIPNDATKVGSVTINVTGDTTYSDGVEYLVSAVDVSNTAGSGANAKQLPISIDVSVASNTTNDPATTLGTADSDYFTNRGASANTSIYKVLASDVIENNDELLVGYIKTGATGVDGNIVIRAYLDDSKIAISDTYPEQTVRTVKTTGYSSSDCQTVLTGVQDASTYCATAADLQDAIDNEDLTSAQIALLVNAGIVDEYTDGTPSSWVGDRRVFTTTEWNTLQTNGVSFKIKVEANEGVWVEAPASAVPTIDSCPGCVFTYYVPDEHNNEYIYIGSTLDSSNYTDNYEEVVANTGRNYFHGLVIENDEITRAFSCGIKDNVPFCIETNTDGDLYDDNVTALQNLWNNTCTFTDNYGDPVQNAADSWNIECDGAFGANASRNGYTAVGTTGEGYCLVDYETEIECYDE